MRNISANDTNAGENIYGLYLDFLEQVQAEVIARTAPGLTRARLLKTYTPLPREHFEAKFESLCATPAQYERAVATLERGFVSRRRAFSYE